MICLPRRISVTLSLNIEKFRSRPLDGWIQLYPLNTRAYRHHSRWAPLVSSSLFAPLHPKRMKNALEYKNAKFCEIPLRYTNCSLLIFDIQGGDNNIVMVLIREFYRITFTEACTVIEMNIDPHYKSLIATLVSRNTLDYRETKIMLLPFTEIFFHHLLLIAKPESEYRPITNPSFSSEERKKIRRTYISATEIRGMETEPFINFFEMGFTLDKIIVSVTSERVLRPSIESGQRFFRDKMVDSLFDKNELKCTDKVL